jgi:hypothetical protein
VLEVLSADRHDGPDGTPPRRRSDGLHGCFTDDPADFVMIGDRISHPFGGLSPGAEQRQIAGFVLSLGMRYQQFGEPLPHMPKHPVGSGATFMAGRVIQGTAKAADPAVVSQDQLDDVGLPAGPRARDENVAGRV